MPAPRVFVLLALATVLVAASAAVPSLGRWALAGDAALVVLFLIDFARARRAPLTARREWPAMLVQGVAAEVRVELTTRGPRPLAIRLRDALHPALAGAPRRTSATVAPGRHAVWSYPLRPRRRGAHPAGPLVARVLGPWRLALAQRVLLPGETCHVYPQMRFEGRVGRLLLLAHRRALGYNPQRLRGPGGEPYALRTYRPGDPMAKIHWKASARHGRLISREETWERGARLIILLDCGRAMAAQQEGRSKLDHALAAALALVRVATARGDRVTVAAFSDRVERTVRLRGNRAAVAYAGLYDLEARLVEPAFDVAGELAAGLESRRSTVVLFTSVVDLASAELLQRSLLTLERRHRPLLINLEDPELADLARAAPDDPAGAFAKVAALQVMAANRALATRLRHAGVRVVTTPADRLALTALETYLAIFAARAA
ncbi:MAG: DUF58 domain-containing protein [Acidobacteria bacterium]|nr:MAG: DUF58 domain-containing protein [Acidobacteriota bacterium]